MVFDQLADAWRAINMRNDFEQKVWSRKGSFDLRQINFAVLVAHRAGRDPKWYASTMPTADIPQSDDTSPNQRFVLGEEEMADVSLATFHLFDKENIGNDNMQLAVVVVGRCRGCGGYRACRGCAVVRACGACGGCGVAALLPILGTVPLVLSPTT